MWLLWHMRGLILALPRWWRGHCVPTIEGRPDGRPGAFTILVYGGHHIVHLLIHFVDRDNIWLFVSRKPMRLPRPAVCQLPKGSHTKAFIPLTDISY